MRVKVFDKGIVGAVVVIVEFRLAHLVNDPPRLGALEATRLRVRKLELVGAVDIRGVAKEITAARGRSLLWRAGGVVAILDGFAFIPRVAILRPLVFGTVLLNFQVTREYNLHTECTAQNTRGRHLFA